VMAPPQLSVSLALTEAVRAKLDSLFGRICLILRSLNKVTPVRSKKPKSKAIGSLYNYAVILICVSFGKYCSQFSSYSQFLQ